MFVTKLAKLFGRQSAGISMAKLIRRLDDCHIPSDVRKITELLEVIDEKVGGEAGGKGVA
jgi:hypothetical protein